MSELLLRHPNRESWQNQDPQAFRISRSPRKHHIQVEVKFEKKWRSVSWKTCVTGTAKPPTEMNKLNSAMRYAVRKQIKSFKSKHPVRECALCGEKSSRKIEVDHDKDSGDTFKNLRDRYIAENPEKPENFWWNPKGRSFVFSGKKEVKQWEAGWQFFHEKHARFRYLCEDCNKKER